MPVSAVAAIASKARRFNAENNITGLLIFDGMRFCQQLESAQKQVLALMSGYADMQIRGYAKTRGTAKSTSFIMGCWPNAGF